MSKRNHIIERTSDVNGGQYIQTNPSYNSGYEDGKKAGKEYCASVIESLREQVEKLTEAYSQCGRTVQEYGRTIDQTESRLREVATHCANVEQQLAALDEQNKKMRAFVTKISEQTPEKPDYWSSCGQCEHNSSNAEDLLELPNLATSILNKEEGEIK